MNTKCQPHPIPAEGIPSVPSWDVSGDLKCLAWRAYRPDRETLKVRIGKATRELARASAVGEPAVSAVGPGRFLVLAPLCQGGTWRAALFDVSQEDVRVLPDLPVQADLICGATMRRAGNRAVYAAVEWHRGGRSRVSVSRIRDGKAAPVLATPEGQDAYRPSVAVVEGKPILAFDAWNGEAYRVFLQNERCVRPLSSGSGWHLRPDMLAIGNTVWCVWVRTTDVTNADGVIDSRCEIMATRLEYKSDDLAVKDRLGVVEDLSHGLLDTSPEPQGVMGYLGRRCHPMLMQTSTGTRLLWEQKRWHSEGTTRNMGVLWSRSLAGSGVGAALPLADEGMGYAPAGSRFSEEEAFEVCCLRGGWHHERQIGFLPTEPSETERIDAKHWQGWYPIDLPCGNDQESKRPSIECDGRTYHLYWLDPHAHSGLSADAEGEIDALYRYARYKALLDGVAFTENDHIYSDSLTRDAWRRACEAADAACEPGRFVTLFGYEWTCERPIQGEWRRDHRNVLLPRPTDDIVRWLESGSDYTSLCDFVEREGGILHAHHGQWYLEGPPTEANVEACSSWSAYFEDPSWYHDALLRGHRVGAVGGSDSHRRNPGLGGSLTGVWAKDLTRESILDAFRRHRCYATTGRRVLIDLRLNGRPMGSTVRSGRADITLKIVSPLPLASIRLVRDGVTLNTWEPVDACAFDTAVRDTPAAGEHFYYLAVSLRDDGRRQRLPANLMSAAGPLAWSSPVWLCVE